MKTIRIGYWKSSSSAPINNCQTCVSSPHRSSTNTNRTPLMSESYSLPTEPEGVIPSLIDRFNSGKVSAMETLYEGAVLIADDGRTVTDRAEIAAELERDLSLGLPLEAKVFLTAISPRSWWTGQLMAQVPTASTCTSKARQ